MWRYEYVKFAVLVMTFFLVALSDHIPVRAARSRKLPKMVCTTRESTFQKRRLTNEIGTSNTAINSIMERVDFDNYINYESSFWVRNACHKGFVVVKEQSKVLAQHEGLDQHDEEVELIKETCVDYGAKISDPVKTRLYSPSAHRYICFNQRGKIRTMRRQRAERLGNLCAFYENVVPNSAMTGGQPDAALYVTYQSAINKDWYLGFGPNPLRKRRFRKKKKESKTSHFHRGIVYTRNGYKATQPRKMATHHKKNRNLVGLVKTDRCDFRFHTGRYTPQNVEKEWKGLFEHILQNVDSNLANHPKAPKRKITKTANKISIRLSHNKKKSKVMSKFRTKQNYIASKQRKLSLPSSHHGNSNSLKKNVNPNSFHDLDKEKMQSDQMKSNTTTLTKTKNFYTNRSSYLPHDKFDTMGFEAQTNPINGLMVSNDDVIPTNSTWTLHYNRNNIADSNNTSKLLTDDIISNSSLSSQNGNSQKPFNTVAATIQSDSAASPSSSSINYRKRFNSSQNPRNKKISKHKSVSSRHESNDMSIHDTGKEQANNNPSTISDANVLSHERTPVLPSLGRGEEILARRNKLLRRIQSLKQQKSVINSKSYPIRNKMQLKSGSKSIKARLRQRRLRLKYLRQHERPVNSYLYMHNVPRKVKRRLPLIKPTLSPEVRSEVTVN